MDNNRSPHILIIATMNQRIVVNIFVILIYGTGLGEFSIQGGLILEIWSCQMKTKVWHVKRAVGNFHLGFVQYWKLNKKLNCFVDLLNKSEELPLPWSMVCGVGYIISVNIFIDHHHNRRPVNMILWDSLLYWRLALTLIVLSLSPSK